MQNTYLSFVTRSLFMYLKYTLTGALLYPLVVLVFYILAIPASLRSFFESIIFILLYPASLFARFTTGLFSIPGSLVPWDLLFLFFLAIGTLLTGAISGLLVSLVKCVIGHRAN